MKLVLHWLVILLGFYSLAAQADITLTAPNEVPAGAPINIKLGGTLGNQDFVTVVQPDTPEGKYSDYQYVRSKNSMELHAPEEAGQYEIRYLDANSPYPTRARRKLAVTPASATVQAPAQADAGAEITVTWSGPDNPADFISLSDPDGDAKARKWISYVYTRKGSPTTLQLPDKPGTYEIKYRTGVKYYTLATATIQIANTSASVTAPEHVQAGQHFDVNWSGPGNNQDFIAISPANSDMHKYRHYRYTNRGSPVTLHAPDEPGQYEVRYQTGQSYAILATQRITVDAVSATLDGPVQVQGGGSFDVTWTGPDNPGDYITITTIGADKRASAKGKWAYTHYGSPSTLRAPLEPGPYELRYQTGQSGAILATRALEVTPPELPPGQLHVTLDSDTTGFGSEDAVEIILDASGSMLKKQDGKLRIEIAREVLLDLTGGVIPEGTPFALRVFGHKQADSCRTDLEEALGPLKAERIDAKIKGINAMNLAKTPIARSLDLVSKDLATVAGERTVVLVTDGEETCGGDPAEVIKSMKAAGTHIKINIVGFSIDDEALKSRFRYWADLGGGQYHDAANAHDLHESMQHALKAIYDVYSSDNQYVASGTVGDDGIELPPGEYKVQTRTSPPLQGKVTVISGKSTALLVR